MCLSDTLVAGKLTAESDGRFAGIWTATYGQREGTAQLQRLDFQNDVEILGSPGAQGVAGANRAPFFVEVRTSPPLP